MSGLLACSAQIESPRSHSPSNSASRAWKSEWFLRLVDRERTRSLASRGSTPTGTAFAMASLHSVASRSHCGQMECPAPRNSPIRAARIVLPISGLVITKSSSQHQAGTHLPAQTSGWTPQSIVMRCRHRVSRTHSCFSHPDKPSRTLMRG